jgi:hypothetical protein
MTPIKTVLHYFFAILIGSLAGLAIAASITALVVPRAEASHHPDPTNYCNALAQFAWHATELRDQGYRIESHVPYINRIENLILRQDVITIVKNIYTEPHLSPAEEATIAFDFCYRIHGA